LIGYTPGDQFRKLDAFQYTVEDVSGNRASAIVRVGYYLESTGDTSFNVKVSADQVQGTMQGAAIAFQDADGNALISIEYGGDEKEFVGVLVRSPELTGTFASDALEDPFFPQLSGFAWIYGTLAEVNGILASLRSRCALSPSKTTGASPPFVACLESAPSPQHPDGHGWIRKRYLHRTGISLDDSHRIDGERSFVRRFSARLALRRCRCGYHASRIGGTVLVRRYLEA
jgi:hypothetical protein